MVDASIQGARVATYCLFLIHGIYVSTWIASIPGLKVAFALGDGQLGFTLLCSGIASFFLTIPAGKLIESAGASSVAFFAGITTPLLASTLTQWTSHKDLLYLLCFINGGIYVGVGISMNSHAVKLERLLCKPIMSSFHACWSIGALVGSAHYAFLLQRGFTWETAFPPICYAIAIGTAIATSCMELPAELLAPTAVEDGDSAVTDVDKGDLSVSKSESPIFVPVLCMMGAFAMLTEGSVGDWTGIYFIRYDAASFASAPLGYTAYAACMTCCRLFGDKLVSSFGRRGVFAAGSFLGVLGFTLLISVPRLDVGMIGCALLGLGLANNLPILTTCIGRSKLVEPSVSIAALATASQTGLLAGPATLGFISRLYGLRVAFFVPLVCIIIIALGSRILPKEDRASEKNELCKALLIDIAYAAPQPISP